MKDIITARSSIRQMKVSGLLLRTVSDYLAKGHIILSIKPMILGISAVDVSPDLSRAMLYLSVYGVTESQKQLILREFSSQVGGLRAFIAKHVALKRVPQICFRWDSSAKDLNRMKKVFDEL